MSSEQEAPIVTETQPAPTTIVEETTEVPDVAADHSTMDVTSLPDLTADLDPDVNTLVACTLGKLVCL